MTMLIAAKYPWQRTDLDELWNLCSSQAMLITFDTEAEARRFIHRCHSYRSKFRRHGHPQMHLLEAVDFRLKGSDASGRTRVLAGPALAEFTESSDLREQLKKFKDAEPKRRAKPSTQLELFEEEEPKDDFTQFEKLYGRKNES